MYHWTYLELQRYFEMYDILNPASAQRIYEECSAKLRTPAYNVKNILRKMKVVTVCTTDDPTDDLGFHQQLKTDGFEIPILPAFRPDKAMEISEPEKFVAYTKKLEAVSNISISTFDDFLVALKSRHDFFAAIGCTVSDHGLEEMYAEDFTGNDIDAVFTKVYAGKALNHTE